MIFYSQNIDLILKQVVAYRVVPAPDERFLDFSGKVRDFIPVLTSKQHAGKYFLLFIFLMMLDFSVTMMDFQRNNYVV